MPQQVDDEVRSRLRGVHLHQYSCMPRSWDDPKLIRRSSGALSQEVHSAGCDCYVPLLCGGDGLRSHLVEGGGGVRVLSCQHAPSSTMCSWRARVR